MKFLIYLLFLTFPLGQIVRWEFFNSQLVLRPNDFIACLLGACGLIAGLTPANQGSTLRNLRKPLLIFYFFIFISLLVNIRNYSLNALLISASYAVRFILYSGLYFVFKEIKIKNIYPIFTLTIVAIALFGFGQYWLIPDVRFLKDFGWDDHYYRLISTFLDPGFTGAILVLGLIIIFLRHSGLSRIIVYIAMALTYSRASYLMFLTAFSLIAFYKKSLKIFLTTVFLILLTLIFLPRTFGEGTNLSREYSFWGRLNNWRETIIVWTKNPVFGVGFNAYRYATSAPISSHAGAGADSSLLLILATTGLTGFLAYLYLLQKIWLLGHKSLLFKTVFLTIFVGSWFNNLWLYPFILEWFWIILATEST